MTAQQRIHAPHPVGMLVIGSRVFAPSASRWPTQGRRPDDHPGLLYLGL